MTFMCGTKMVRYKKYVLIVINSKHQVFYVMFSYIVIASYV